MLKYVDDNIIHEKLCFDGAVIDAEGKKVVHAIRTQNLFRQITAIAESMGMKVNSLKTQMLCISDAKTYHPEAYIEDVNHQTITSTDKMKILGVNFSNKPDASAYVEAVVKKFRSRVWVLRLLHQNGF